MTAGLSSKHYRDDGGHDAEDFNLHSHSLFGESLESTLSPFAIHLSSSLVTANRKKLPRRDCKGFQPRVVRGRGRRPSIVQGAVRDQVELSAVALVLSTFKRTGLSCQQAGPEDIKMDIGWPTDVQHVTHVTFDRFNGFLGLPAEFEVELPRSAPSASASVFGVSPESMQCAFDARGNSVPMILLLLQEKLYEQDGLKAEGIFRINAENGQEQRVREQLNKGVVPDDIDVHCLAGLIKAWFRELPKGLLDYLSPEQVMHCHSEEQCLALVRTLPPTQGALLNWVVNLMTDVVLLEHLNKMNARNIAMVFAPNMTQTADPLTALMHVVQVMNLLKTLIYEATKYREDSMWVTTSPCAHSFPDRHRFCYPSKSQVSNIPGGIESKGVFNNRSHNMLIREREQLEEYKASCDLEMLSSSRDTSDEDKRSSDSWSYESSTVLSSYTTDNIGMYSGHP